MGLRHWFRERMLKGDSEGDDVPPGSALMNTLLGRDVERHRSLGDYDSTNYPANLRALLTRRAEVAQDLLQLDIADAGARAAAIPKLRELLRRYPHPLVYETLIHACLDSGRFDEAKGVVFAARQRRIECLSSEYPEIRAEVESLREWDIDEIDELRGTYSERG
jgi:pentatricopeptide repeat protein